MTDDQTKHMVERFLSWKLPENFNPDGGVSFTPTFNNGTPSGGRHEPTGTNLLDYTQATAMVRHMLEGLPMTDTPNFEARITAAEKAIKAALKEILVLAETHGDSDEANDLYDLARAARMAVLAVCATARDYARRADGE